MSDPADRIPPDWRCNGQTRASGGAPCRKTAGWGTDHPGYGRCKLHGGSHRNGRKQGARLGAEHEMEVAVREAREAGIVMGDPEEIDPHEALLQCISIAAGEVRYASERIAELEPDEAVGPVVTTRPRKLQKGAESKTERIEEHGQPALHIWIVVRQQAMDRLVNYSRIAIAAGIAERQVQLAEGQAKLIADGYRRLVVALGLDPADPKVREAMRGSLTVIAGGRAA